MRWQHCLILKKHKLLSFDMFMIYKCVNGLASAVLCPHVTKTHTNRITTRGSAQGNCRVAQHKTTFGQSSFNQLLEWKHKLTWNCLIERWKTDWTFGYMHIFFDVWCCKYINVLMMLWFIDVFLIIAQEKSLTRDKDCKLALARNLICNASVMFFCILPDK